MKATRLVIGILVIALCATPMFAQVGKGLSGPHFNLNVVGVPHDKTAPMDNFDRHTIFVPLQSGSDVSRQVKIYYVPGTEFGIIDGNATDDNVAVIQVPASDFSTLSYDVYAVGLGKPNKGAIIGVECAYDYDTIGDVTCTDTLLMDSFEVDRLKGKPQRVNITDAFRATGCMDVDNSGDITAGDYCFTDVWVFNIPDLSYYFWDYDNNGLKLMQLRFYETTSGTWTQY